MESVIIVTNVLLGMLYNEATFHTAPNFSKTTTCWIWTTFSSYTYPPKKKPQTLIYTNKFYAEVDLRVSSSLFRRTANIFANKANLCTLLWKIIIFFSKICRVYFLNILVLISNMVWSSFGGGAVHLQHMEFLRLGVCSELKLLAYSHSNARSEPSLRPTPQLTATLDP